jgi:hypothetical protein
MNRDFNIIYLQENLFIDFLKYEIDAMELVSIFENAIITLMFEKFDSKKM